MRTRWKTTLSEHAQCTKWYNVLEIAGLVNATCWMDMEITTIGPDGTRTSTVENTCVLKLLWKVMGMASNGMNRKVIQACFPSRGGTYAMWYAGNDEKIKAHAEDFLRNPAASFMHRCIRWGFKTEDVVNMINV